LRIWPYCEPIGVEFTSLKKVSVVQYMGKYAGKFESLLKLKGEEVERVLAWFKYFKRRLFSFRHNKIWNEKSRRILMRENDWFEKQEV
jgi:hypothetical protein